MFVKICQHIFVLTGIVTSYLNRMTVHRNESGYKLWNKPSTYHECYIILLQYRISSITEMTCILDDRQRSK